MSQKYVRPGGAVKFMNGVVGFFAGMGLTPKHMVVIETVGRKSGKQRRVPVNIVEYEGAEYLVAPRGNTEWYRNVKAAGGAANLKHGKSRPVRLEEVPVDARPPIIKKYLAENAAATKASFGVEPGAPIEDFQRIAPDHPTLRIHDA
jgi:deazaflavin-dependent oxidoreductase (nitroreductase family)